MLHYMILTTCYIVNDIFRLHVVKVLLIWREKGNLIIKMQTLHSNTLKLYVTLYATYLLLYCKGHIQIRSSQTLLI